MTTRQPHIITVAIAIVIVMSFGGLLAYVADASSRVLLGMPINHFISGCIGSASVIGIVVSRASIRKP